MLRIKNESFTKCFRGVGRSNKKDLQSIKTFTLNRKVWDDAPAMTEPSEALKEQTTRTLCVSNEVINELTAKMEARSKIFAEMPPITVDECAYQAFKIFAARARSHEELDCTWPDGFSISGVAFTAGTIEGADVWEYLTCRTSEDVLCGPVAVSTQPHLDLLVAMPYDEVKRIGKAIAALMDPEVNRAYQLLCKDILGGFIFDHVKEEIQMQFPIRDGYEDPLSLRFVQIFGFTDSAVDDLREFLDTFKALDGEVALSKLLGQINDRISKCAVALTERLQACSEVWWPKLPRWGDDGFLATLNVVNYMTNELSIELCAQYQNRVRDVERLTWHITETETVKANIAEYDADSPIIKDLQFRQADAARALDNYNVLCQRLDFFYGLLAYERAGDRQAASAQAMQCKHAFLGVKGKPKKQSDMEFLDRYASKELALFNDVSSGAPAGPPPPLSVAGPPPPLQAPHRLSGQWQWQ